MNPTVDVVVTIDTHLREAGAPAVIAVDPAHYVSRDDERDLAEVDGAVDYLLDLLESGLADVTGELEELSADTLRRDVQAARTRAVRLTGAASQRIADLQGALVRAIEREGRTC